MVNDVITRSHTRILTPSEYAKLREQMNTKYQIVSDALLMTGLRTVEFWRMKPEWYRAARRVLELPIGACLKKKCQWKQRTVYLSLPACDAIEDFLRHNYKPLKENSMRDAYIRYADKAGIGSIGITTKMFRKTWVSWLVACYPERALEISGSMGHNLEVMRKNYLGLGFTPEEKEKMKVYLTGWERK